jgi:DNA-binding MarR family transcriptional regulator
VAIGGLSNLLRIAQQRLKRIYGRQLPDGLTFARITVLESLIEGGGRTQEGLMRACSIDRTTISILIDGAVRDGLLQRQPMVGDRRANFIRITSKGRKAWKRSKIALDIAEANLLDDVRPARRAAFLDGLRDLNP